MTSAPPIRDIILARICWQGEVIGANPRGFRTYSVEPEPGWPVGRKGLLFARLWESTATKQSPGMLIQDGDCVTDPFDMGAMFMAAGPDPTSVHVAPVRLYPDATGFSEWVWGHRRPLNERDPIPDDAEAYRIWQEDIGDPLMFSFNFTYLPRRLLEAAIDSGLETWVYPHVDDNMWQLARSLSIPVKVVRGCHPKHLHY
jgi:hypothetical protein